jgi:hypothetical protein
MSYWHEAFWRSLAEAWDWPNSNSIPFGLLTIVLGAGFTIVVEKIWNSPTGKWAWLKNLGLTAISGFVLTITGSFIVFLIQDAPEQIKLADEHVINIRQESMERISALQKEKENLQRQLDAKNIKGLYVECHRAFMPSAYTNRFYTIFIDDTDSMGINEVYFGAANGAPINWGTGTGPVDAVQCTVFNYTDETVFSVDLRPTIDFIKTTVRPDGGEQGSGVDHSRTAYVPIPHIDLGTPNAFVLYFANITSSFVDITMPKIAHAGGLEAVMHLA